MDETSAKHDRSLSVRVGRCVHVAPCITNSAARARLGVRLGDRRDQASAKARFRASAVCRCEGSRYTLTDG